MKILFSSYKFYPNIGGIQTVSLLLAHEFSRLGHNVIVITDTPDEGSKQTFAFDVVRRPSSKRLIQLCRWADVVFHNNISLRAAWPLMFIWRPWVVAHHIWLPRRRDLRGLKGALKRMVLRRTKGIAVSNVIAADVATPCTVVRNPYDDKSFRLIPGVQRDRDLVFVGRLVSDKGIPVLLEALGRLAPTGLRPDLTIIGIGPEGPAWLRLAEGLGLSEQVEFVGIKRGEELAETLNRHRIMVIPSLCNETFGVVALEGIACGCLVIGSKGGGLQQAIGPAGLTVTNGDVDGLATAIEKALCDPTVAARCRAAAPKHLALHRPAVIARRYLDVLEQAAS